MKFVIHFEPDRMNPKGKSVRIDNIDDFIRVVMVASRKKRVIESIMNG